MNINPSCEHKTITLMHVLNIVLLIRKGNQFKGIAQVIFIKPLQVVGEIGGSKTYPNLFFHATGLCCRGS